MKTIKHLLQVIGCVALVFSCTPPDDPEFGAPPSPSDVKFSVTQDPSYDNKVFLSNESTGILPYWDYGLGVSHNDKDTIIFPFFGDYWVKFSAFGRAGSRTDSTKITVTKNDPSYFLSPAEWGLLTNGAAGKTWIFDTVDPISYHGPKYLGGPGGDGDAWLYDPGSCPSWSGFPCGTDWGEMTFDLDGNYNVTVKQKSLTDDTYTTNKGIFGFDIKNKTLSFIGTPMLYSANKANWNKAYVFQVTTDVLYLGVVAPDGGHMRFRYVPKP